MERAAIANALRRFIKENYLLGRDFSFTDDDSFLEHSIVDSIGILQLATFLQDTYGITVQDEELLPENLDSINAVTAYLCRKLDGAASHDAPTASQTAPGERA
jgi:acyl carrier protein